MSDKRSGLRSVRLRKKWGAYTPHVGKVHVVRLASDQQLVGVFLAQFVDDLVEQIDEITDPAECEYCVIPTFGILWTSKTFPVPYVDRGDDDAFNHEWSFSEQTEDCIRSAKWKPLGVSFIYFIQAGGSIKIGFAKDPEDRRLTLQTANASRLELVWIMIGDRRDEAEMHARFSADRQHGEWFAFSAEIKDFLRDQGCDHDALED
jgi:hypothetical protein